MAWGKTRWCAQCRSGEIETPADVEVVGRVMSVSSDREMPYHAYLCDDHLEAMESDGNVLRVIERFTK